MINDWSLPAVDQLESREMYREALALLSSEWKKSPSNLKIMIRLGFLNWYLAVESGVLGEKGLNSLEISECEIILSELTLFGQKAFNDDSDFLWMFGYIMSLFPENFHLPSTEDVEELGKTMLKKAFELRPEDKIIELLYLSNDPTRTSSIYYKQICTEVAEILSLRFQGSGELQQYFQEVLNRN